MKNRLVSLIGALILGLCAMTMAQDQPADRSNLTLAPA